jgi:hypothetical protein
VCPLEDPSGMLNDPSETAHSKISVCLVLMGIFSAEVSMGSFSSSELCDKRFDVLVRAVVGYTSRTYGELVAC